MLGGTSSGRHHPWELEHNEVSGFSCQGLSEDTYGELADGSCTSLPATRDITSYSVLTKVAQLYLSLTSTGARLTISQPNLHGVC